MNTDRFERLKRLVKTSLILLPAQRESWLARMPKMQEEDLLELEDILVSSMGIEWNKVLPTYKESLGSVTQYVQSKLSVSSHK